MLMVVIVIFKTVEASLFNKWNPWFIQQIFKSSVSSMKDPIISLSFILFIAVVSMVLQ